MANSELLNEHPPIDKAVMAFLGGILPGLGKMDGTAKPKTPEEAWADADEQARDVMRAGVAAVIRTQLDELRAENERLKEALEPFAKCVEQIDDREDDEEWAKFRLLIKDYRRANRAFSGARNGFVRCKTCGGEFDEAEWDSSSECPECETPINRKALGGTNAG